jgi:valyl-tRNA synthetase
MILSKRYDPLEAEPRLAAFWEKEKIYHFDLNASGPVYSIDTPPPSVSGHLHLGHVYSYSHPDFMARFYRMNGYNVFYPMGYDDNGLPTERLVEKRLGAAAVHMGRSTFIDQCLKISEEVERDYEDLWKRLGLSIDWRYTYRTIDLLSRRASQLSFIELYKQGKAYRRESPAIWCPECQTSIAQADLNDLERQSELVILSFQLDDGSSLPIATTRPELLPACVAVFIHPKDARYAHLTGKYARSPLFNKKIPVLSDPLADPNKGTGAVMCCTFGDTTDIVWWHNHQLPMVEVIGSDGRMTHAAGKYAGLTTSDARRSLLQNLEDSQQVMDRQLITQSVRVHERCDTPVEYILIKQWFISLLEHKESLKIQGEKVEWFPPQMQARYRAWVENLNWDWCISRQRFFGIPFPVWYCRRCGEVIVADESELPVDPLEQQPNKPCHCGSLDFVPEEDVLDTWATSSLTPQIVGQRLENPALYDKVFPFSVRPQAHEIIRTWAFYTLVKSHFHFDSLPWQQILISGWGLAGNDGDKISKSRGGGPMAPMEMIRSYSADAVRYWSSSTGAGKDSIISVEKIQAGARLVTKLWNVARFSERFLEKSSNPGIPPSLSPADRWILACLQSLIRRVTIHFTKYDYAAAKSEIESFFWNNLADNYLEMCKQRLYDSHSPLNEGARFTLQRILIAVLKLFAPFLPYVTEEIYQGLFRQSIANGCETESDLLSIHLSSWPEVDSQFDDPSFERLGEWLLFIAGAVRRFKSEHNLSLGTELNRLQLAAGNPSLAFILEEAAVDLRSITRAQIVEIVPELLPGLELILEVNELSAAVETQTEIIE